MLGLRIILIFTSIFFCACSAGAGESPEKLYEIGREAYNRFSERGIDESIVFFERVVDLSPDNAAAHSALAESYVQKFMRSKERDKRLLEKAFESAERALLLDAKSPEAHKALGSAYFASGKIEEAIEELERAVDMEPRYARAWLNLGTCRLELGDRDKAMEFFRTAVDIGNDPLAEGIGYYNIASLQSEEKRFEEALKNYRMAEKRVPEYHNIYYGLGVVLMHLGRDEEAIASMRRAVELKPDNAEAYLGLASAYHRSGNKKDAEKAYKTALSLDPRLDEAERGLAALKGKKVGCLFFY